MTRVRPYLILLILWAGYFHPLILHPAQTLFAPYSDFLAEHLPAKLYLNREWRETGELPLWNPYHFCGSPFVHDIQVGAFYPPNAVVYLIHESSVGAALSWVIAIHVLAAGAFAYIYARSHQLNEVGSLVAAVGFMLSSKWMTHLLLAGHTITIGLAWLPLVLLGVERGIATRSKRPVLGAGVALALLGLGTHPQWAFYAGVFALAWTVPAERIHLARWAVCWVSACATAAAPRRGAVATDIGSGAVVGGAACWMPPTRSRSASTRCSHSSVRRGSTRPPRSWEVQGVLGLFWLGAACAPLIAGGRAGGGSACSAGC